MSPVEQEQRGRGRINIRVDPEQEARLRAAAEANGETLTGFLLTAAAERAEEVLARAGRIAVNSAAFERFVAALDAPAETMPTVERYALPPITSTSSTPVSTISTAGCVTPLRSPQRPALRRRTFFAEAIRSSAITR
jgi:uncharacterized protein (DUF1778 family)